MCGADEVAVASATGPMGFGVGRDKEDTKEEGEKEARRGRDRTSLPASAFVSPRPLSRTSTIFLPFQYGHTKCDRVSSHVKDLEKASEACAGAACVG